MVDPSSLECFPGGDKDQCLTILYLGKSPISSNPPLFSVVTVGSDQMPTRKRNFDAITITQALCQLTSDLNRCACRKNLSRLLYRACWSRTHSHTNVQKDCHGHTHVHTHIHIHTNKHTHTGSSDVNVPTKISCGLVFEPQRQGPLLVIFRMRLACLCV